MKYFVAFTILITLFVLMGIIILKVAKERDTKRARDRSGLQLSLRRRRFGRRYSDHEYDEERTGRRGRRRFGTRGLDDEDTRDE